MGEKKNLLGAFIVQTQLLPVDKYLLLVLTLSRTATLGRGLFQATEHWLLNQVKGNQSQAEMLLGPQMTLSAMDHVSLSEQAAWSLVLLGVFIQQSTMTPVLVC